MSNNTRLEQELITKKMGDARFSDKLIDEAHENLSNVFSGITKHEVIEEYFKGLTVKTLDDKTEFDYLPVVEPIKFLDSNEESNEESNEPCNTINEESDASDNDIVGEVMNDKTDTDIETNVYVDDMPKYTKKSKNVKK